MKWCSANPSQYLSHLASFWSPPSPAEAGRLTMPCCKPTASVCTKTVSPNSQGSQASTKRLTGFGPTSATEARPPPNSSGLTTSPARDRQYLPFCLRF